MYVLDWERWDAKTLIGKGRERKRDHDLEYDIPTGWEREILLMNIDIYEY